MTQLLHCAETVEPADTSALLKYVLLTTSSPLNARIQVLSLSRISSKMSNVNTTVLIQVAYVWKLNVMSSVTVAGLGDHQQRFEDVGVL